MNLLPVSSTVKMGATGSSAMLVNSLLAYTIHIYYKIEIIMIPQQCGALIFKLLSDYTDFTLQSRDHQNTNNLQYMHI